MGTLSDRFVRSLLGALLLCVFSLRPCAAIVRNVSALKNLNAIEKGIEESSKENKEAKEGKERFKAEFEVPAAVCTANIGIPECTGRQLILREIQGCPGPILQISTPPPDRQPLV
jgi:hypothetical protein